MFRDGPTGICSEFLMCWEQPLVSWIAGASSNIIQCGKREGAGPLTFGAAGHHQIFKMMKTYHDEVGRGECPQFSSLGWVQIDHRDFVLKAHCYSTPSFGNSSKITGKRISRHSPRWGLKLSAFATETNSADVRAMVAMLPGRRALRRENWSIVGHPAVQVLLVTALSAAGIFGDGAEVNEAHWARSHPRGNSAVRQEVKEIIPNISQHFAPNYGIGSRPEYILVPSLRGWTSICQLFWWFWWFWVLMAAIWSFLVWHLNHPESGSCQRYLRPSNAVEDDGNFDSDESWEELGPWAPESWIHTETQKLGCWGRLLQVAKEWEICVCFWYWKINIFYQRMKSHPEWNQKCRGILPFLLFWNNV